MNKLPNKIWIYWDKGMNTCPEIVKLCVESWHIHNKNWGITLLSENNIKDFIDSNFLSRDFFLRLPIQKRANIIRLYLLNKYGGVWIDATCYCVKPLDEWINNHMKSGFFAFSSADTSRYIANWFIASHPNNYLIESFLDEHIKYWESFTPASRKGYKKIMERLFKLLPFSEKRTYEFWNSFFIKKILRVYPYFIFHYHLRHHLEEDQKAWAILSEMPRFHNHQKFSPMLRLKKFYNKKIPISAIYEESETCKNPVIKFSWKANWIN